MNEIESGVVSFHPFFIDKENVGFIRIDQKLYVHISLFAELLDQVGRLIEVDIPVIIAVDKQHRGFPRLHIGNG